MLARYTHRADRRGREAVLGGNGQATEALAGAARVRATLGDGDDAAPAVSLAAHRACRVDALPERRGMGASPGWFRWRILTFNGLASLQPLDLSGNRLTALPSRTGIFDRRSRLTGGRLRELRLLRQLPSRLAGPPLRRARHQRPRAERAKGRPQPMPAARRAGSAGFLARLAAHPA